MIYGELGRFPLKYNIDSRIINILSLKNRIVFTRFRLSDHRLPIKTGLLLNIQREERICVMFNKGCIGDEFHFLFKCTVLNDLRKRYLSTYYCKHSSVINIVKLY